MSVKNALVTICFALAFLVATATFSLAESEVKFNRDIRPILANNCFQCHGPSEKDRKAEMRLDEEDGILTAFEAGDLDSSEAWTRINSKDPKKQMPPAKSHKELKPTEIALIGEWIKQGAKWEGHWAFVPPVKPPVAEVKQKDWIRNPIDAFILARLEKEGLKPQSEAARERLLRRVTFDLTGLPPTIEEIDAFLADKSDNAYEKVVDRLLKSDPFGERMALAWMDAARYGDSSVFHADGPRQMWGWRDWVINAYNINKPFDEFTIEQLAGDLVPNSTVEQQIATAFNRNNATTDEGGAIAEEYRIEYAVDRVKTTSMVWLGLSMECGQCHDHKYDPISQRDYYRFFAYFNQASDPGMQSRGGNQAPIVKGPSPLGGGKDSEIKHRIAGIEEQMKKHAASVDGPFNAWLKKASAKPQETPAPANLALHYALDEGQGNDIENLAAPDSKGKVNGNSLWEEGKFGQAFKLDGGNFVDLGDVGNFERTDSFSYGAWIKPQGQASGAAIARMDDGAKFRGYDLFMAGGKVAVHIVNTWPGNAVKVTTKAALKPDQWQHVFATYDGSSKAAGIKIYFDGKPQEWAIEQDGLKDSIRTSKTLYLGRRTPSSPFKGSIDDVRIYSRALSDTEVAALAGSDPIGPLLAIAADKRTEQQLAILRQHFLSGYDDKYKDMQANLAKAKAELAAQARPQTSVMVMKDVPRMRMTYILDRGNYASPKKDQPVQPGVPAALSPLPKDAPPNRLGMAQWLVQPSHPLTARVAVNRYWYMLFGTGIVKSVEDFGSQGEWPTHPALLDYLAVDFVESGWDIKRMLKQIVTSAAYRQSSRVTRELWQRDPQNRLLARGPRFRLQGEFVRDNALAASGLLVNTIGGPSVKPYQPGGLWIELALGGARFVQDKGDKLYRRSMYIYWKRSSPAPTMTIFDAPTREKCAIRRSRTNTPLQALLTLNGPQYVEASRFLAERAMKAGGSLDDQIVLAHRLATGVKPSDATMGILKEAYAEEYEFFKATADSANKLLAIGEKKRDESLDAATHAAMTIVASMILNLDTTITRG
jgi:hypothetical protein